MNQKLIASNDDLVLVTGANGFIGSRVVDNLVKRGFKNIRCFVRPSSDLSRISNFIDSNAIKIVKGNLLSKEDCAIGTKDVSVIFHLAAGIEKTYAGSFLNSVVTTRNLMDAARKHGSLKRILNVSSFSVYTNRKIKRHSLLDENCALEKHPVERSEAYCYGKLKQEEIVFEYYDKYQLPYVNVRPGVVYGPGKGGLTARIGIDTFGIFMHIGGKNRIPLIYVDNCAEAIVLAGMVEGINGETFNIVDDDLPKSREFLSQYKKVFPFKSLYIPYRLFYLFCYLWEKYSKLSKEQIPAAFNRYKCSAYYKGNIYSNQKLKKMVNWKPIVDKKTAHEKFFNYEKNNRI